MFSAGQNARSVLSKQTEIDFGSTPVSEASFAVADEDVTVYSRISAFVSYDTPTGKDQDELEMDHLEVICTGGDKQVTMYVRGLTGYVADKFKINYLVA
jgi:hypothetical protein